MRVVDFTMVNFGNWVTKMLVGMGAEVIKIGTHREPAFLVLLPKRSFITCLLPDCLGGKLHRGTASVGQWLLFYRRRLFLLQSDADFPTSSGSVTVTGNNHEE